MSPPHKIDPVEAERLRSEGKQWKEIARILSERIGRWPPFWDGSVKSAVYAYRKAQKNAQP